jgi:UDP-3-O-[3-hydroxymyristoyl] glucosamine N-acyltransferase
MPLSLGEIAVRFGCALRGDPDRLVTGVGTLAGAGPDAITFLANSHYRSALPATRAAAVLLSEAEADMVGTAALITDNPYAAYARVAQLLHPPAPRVPGVHPSADVAPDAKIAGSAWIGPQAVVEARARIGERVFVGPGCVVGAGASLGDDSRLIANVTVLHDALLGRRCVMHPGVVIGSDGFGMAPDDGEWVRVPQVGSVRIGDDVEIGANSAVDRGAIEDTMIGDGVKLDNHVQIGHNVRIGAHTVMAARAGVAGSTVIGRRCMIAADSGFVGHLEIADDVVLMARCMITHSISEPGTYGGGLPGDKLRRWRRNAARFRNLDSLVRRLGALEQSIERWRRGSDGSGG